MRSRNKNLANILLLMCPPWGYTDPPLSLAYLSSYLKKNGRSPRILDINIEMYQESSQKVRELWKLGKFIYWMDEKDFKANIIKRFERSINFYRDKILAQDIRVIGFSVNLYNLLFSIEMAKRIKEKNPDKIIIFGGPHSIFFKADSPDLGIPIYPGLVDIAVKGDGEETLDEILECLEADKPVDNIAGSIIYKGGYYRATIERKPREDLDALPFPDFSDFTLKKYTSDSFPIISSRGCVNKCRYCPEPFYSRKYCHRSARNVFREMLTQMQKYKVKEFYFLDSMMNTNLKELKSFSDLIIKSGIRVVWKGLGFIRKDMSQDLLIRMRKAGCKEIYYGVESFSNKVLKAMNKNYTAGDAARTIRFTEKAGIDAYINLIVGFPGEGEEEFEETLEFLRKIHKDVVGITVCGTCMVLPGAEMQLCPDKYKIIAHKREDIFEWYTYNRSNTYQLRKKRLNKLLSVLLELNLLHHNTVVYGS